MYFNQRHATFGTGMRESKNKKGSAQVGTLQKMNYGR